LTALAPVFRYSRSREAYVLRLIGDSVGPVLQVRPGRGAPPAPVADDAGHFKTGRFERAEPVTEQSSK
jgi:hypothetical protein